MSITLSFTKGHGTGNDFVLVSDPDGELDISADQVAYLCDRRFGVGADGFIRAVLSQNVPEGIAILAEEPSATWFMDYRNSDGSIAEMCGNGIRVFVKYLLDQELATIPNGHTIPIATRAGVKDVAQSVASFQVDLGRWKLHSSNRKITANGASESLLATGIDVGNPHEVVQLPDLAALAALDLSVQPDIEPKLQNGANVEFIVFDDPVVQDGIGRISMRVFERGVGQTLSCGTGAAASALAARQLSGRDAPNNWRVTVPGGTLGVRMFPTEDGEHVSLSGPAELVFSAQITL